jgi:Tat protein translocase TatB subunit
MNRDGAAIHPTPSSQTRRANIRKRLAGQAIHPLGRIAGIRGCLYDEHMNLGMSEMIFIFILALLIFGPRKLPEIAREVGKFMAEFKRAGNEFRNQIETEIQQIELEEQIKKDAERREAAMHEAEQKRLAAQGQGELFETSSETPALSPTEGDKDGAPTAEEMPKILPPEGTIVNEVATPRSSLIEAENTEQQTEPNA